MKFIGLLVVFLLAGCASNDSLYFGTYTRIGIDVSADGAGIGAKNAALNITPPKKEGGTFNVLGTSDLDIAYTDTVIKEIFAVGEAAKCAALKTATFTLTDLKLFLSKSDDDEPAVGPLIFGTYSSWSLLDLSWGDATSIGINFGYKRGTGVKMPIVNDKVGSVYASISINTTDQNHVDAPKSNIGGTRNKHTFATGEAAIIKASQKASSLNGGDISYKGCIKTALL